MLRPLTAELDSKASPVRRFLDDRFTSGLRDVQNRYRQSGPPLVVPSADRAEANPGTVGTAADWLLRFMAHPRPSLALAAAGAAGCGRRSGMAEALIEIAEWLGYDPEAVLDRSATDYTGPVGGCGADPEQLAHICWALALLTEMYRNPMVAARGPLGRFHGRRASVSELLGLASSAVLGQLAAFREVFASTLLPQLATRPGRWVLGPGFTGSALIKSDADLIAAGLLLDLKTESKLSLGVATVFQVIGYALLDFDDEYQLTEVGTFSARYGYLAAWDVGSLLDELAGQPVSLRSCRDEFRRLLLACRLYPQVNGPCSAGGLGQPRAATGAALHAATPAARPRGNKRLLIPYDAPASGSRGGVAAAPEGASADGDAELSAWKCGKINSGFADILTRLAERRLGEAKRVRRAA